MTTNFYQRAPRCLEDRNLLVSRPFSIKTIDDRNFSNAFYYCDQCKKYRANKGMEKSLKKAALEHIRSFDKSYELSDIAEIKPI
jgi:hypothetical protein